MIARAAWRDAIKAKDSGLSTAARFTALIMADYWPHDVADPELWCTNETVADAMGASVRTVRSARAELCAKGWLRLVSRGEASRAARFAPLVPTHAGEGGRFCLPGGKDLPPREAKSAPDPLPTPHGPPTTSTPTGDRIQAATLAAAVVDGVGPGMSLSPGPLNAEARRLTGLGWTPDQLRHAAKAHGWDGCKGGAVIAWLRGLHEPPAPMPRQRPQPRECPRHPGTPALKCQACAAIEIKAPPGWRTRHLATTSPPSSATRHAPPRGNLPRLPLPDVTPVPHAATR